MSKITLIAAMSRNRVIGNDNKLLWNLPRDMQWFREQTKGKVVVMGRKTHQSIGRLLPGRLNVILTCDPTFNVEGAVVVNTIEDAIAAANGADIMVIGGGEIYRLFLPLAKLVLLTVVDGLFEGDTTFPLLTSDEWEHILSTVYEKDERNDHSMYFNIYHRR